VETPQRVFLSHTAELREFPGTGSFLAAAEEAVSRAGHAIADMAYFPVRDDKPADYCRALVRDCDIYVGLIGLRYGTPVRDQPEVSYTELEFDAATEASLPRLVFLLDEEEEVPIPARWLRNSDPDLQAKQRAFRAGLRDSGMVKGTFSSPQRLGLLLLHALNDLRRERQPGMALRLPQRPEFLFGRKELLAELHARLTDRHGGRSGIVALCGPGGAGKTSVAVEYAHRHLAECGVVWQLPAEEPAALAAGLSELAGQLDGRTGPNAGEPRARMHAALAGRDDWLLIFDNAPGPVDIDGLLPPEGGGRVLITSQYPLWPGDQELDVPVLDQVMAARFLRSRTGAGSGDEAASAELAGELGGLPLALEQAAAYMQATDRSIPDYLGLFRESRAELVARGDPAGYDKRVVTAWELAFAELAQSGPASGLLRMVACCAPDDIPLRLLLRPVPGLAETFGPDVAPLLAPLLDSPIACDEAVVGLRRYSLISAPRDGFVSVHRLVQKITLDRLDPEVAKDWRRAVAALIEAALPADAADADDPATWPAFAALLPHAQMALPPGSDGMDKVAAFLRAFGNDSAALQLQRQIVAACDTDRGADHPRTLAARANLATLTGETGDRAAARDQFADLVPALTRVFGAEHPRTLAARASLAYWTGENAEPAAARDQFAAILPELTRRLGEESPAVLAVRANLARTTGDAGDAAGARDHFAALLPIRERVSGDRHPATLTTRASLAYWTGMAGDAAGARDQYAALVPIRAEILGPEHPRTLTARGYLAHWTGQAGDPAAARDQFASLVPVMTGVLGTEHPGTLQARASLDRWTRQAEGG
jgi:Domain of unknown function (DUF4062)/Tetratricopeptide repeat